MGRNKYSYEERVKFWTDMLEKGPDACMEYVQNRLRKLEKSQNFNSTVRTDILKERLDRLESIVQQAVMKLK